MEAAIVSGSAPLPYQREICTEGTPGQYPSSLLERILSVYNQSVNFTSIIVVPCCSLMLSGRPVWCKRGGRWDEGKRQQATRRQRTLNSAVMSSGNKFRVKHKLVSNWSAHIFLQKH